MLIQYANEDLIHECNIIQVNKSILLKPIPSLQKNNPVYDQQRTVRRVLLMTSDSVEYLISD